MRCTEGLAKRSARVWDAKSTEAGWVDFCHNALADIKTAQTGPKGHLQGRPVTATLDALPWNRVQLPAVVGHRSHPSIA